MSNQMEWSELDELTEERSAAGKIPEQGASKGGRVFIELPKNLVAIRTNNLEQNFYTIQLPENVFINGRDFGGWRFTQTKMFTSRFHDDMFVASFPREKWQIALTKPYRKKNGEWDRETQRVTAGALKEALAAARQAAAEK